MVRIGEYRTEQYFIGWLAQLREVGKFFSEIASAPQSVYAPWHRLLHPPSRKPNHAGEAYVSFDTSVAL